MKVMRNYNEIHEMLNYLERKRMEFIDDNQYNIALALAGQIELLKWVLIIDREENKE